MSWICSKCRMEMEDVYDIKLKHKDMELPDATGLRCPGCGVEYLEGEYVTGELNSAEGMLEGK